MSDLNTILKGIVDDVDGAVGAAVVDLNTGLLIGVAHNVPYFTQSYLDAVAASAVDMFRGKNIRAVEKLMSSTRGEAVEKSITEVQMTTANTYHFMLIHPNKPDTLIVLITTKKANLGMGWSAVRSSTIDIEPFCP
ncbi:MAG: hypothetical protein OEY19_03625 [Gammaproteobacteria bacterium]|nr:hypothetical protein [Gammaproteobacteria bacterium]MDH5630320.1 hypothetical protein [Gammaproteobacteria bacterium]